MTNNLHRIAYTLSGAIVIAAWMFGPMASPAAAQGNSPPPPISVTITNLTAARAVDFFRNGGTYREAAALAEAIQREAAASMQAPIVTSGDSK